ncbi:tudor domain-containing 6 [Pungitius pungitius]|uniref:tudor domain-containing 6 n=1 Tax=Pungitius pungitius TaxID=134920 RepID=UPI002E0EEBBD
MCSIPGLPKLGSEVPVVITRVNLNPNCGLVELWVHIDDGRKHVYNQMKEEIQIPKREFSGSEGKPGDLCLVCISATWHRARIVSFPAETCNVFLIDQGQSHITTSEALAWGHSDCFLLPPETESCLLANVVSLENKWPEIATKFLVSLSGKKFVGLIQHVLMPDRTILLDIPSVSTHVCEIGVTKKMPMDEFKSLVQKCLEAERLTHGQKVNKNQLEKQGEYFYPELLTDAFEIVNVTQVTSPCKMFCKLHIFSKAVTILSEQIKQHYEENSDLGETEPLTCGDPCAARGVDGRWHRSLLQETLNSDGAVEVLYVDEGKLEVLPIGDVRPLHGKFLRMPVVTYPCSLEGIKDNGKGWTTGQIDYLNSLLLNQKFVAKFNHHNIRQNVYNVILYGDNDTCMNNCFKELFSSKTEQDTNFQNGPLTSTFLSLPGKQGSIDLPNKVPVNVDVLQEETWPSTKNQAVNGMTNDLTTSQGDHLPIKESSEHRDPMVQINKHLSKGFPSEMQSPCDDDMLTVGSSVDVIVSFVESPHTFWCQPRKNFEHLGLLMQDLQNHYESIPPQPLVESICVARNPGDGMWYRVRTHASHRSPVVDVRFIDYGKTELVPLQDILPIDPAFLRLNPQAFQCSLFNGETSISPPKQSVSRSVDTVPLASFKVPTEVPEEVNRWFADSTIGQKCTISVVAKGEKGKLVVELFAGALNLNVKVREMISKLTQEETFSLVQQTDEQLSNCTESGSVPHEDCLMQEFTNVSLLTMKDDMNEVQNDNGSYVRDGLSEQFITNACEHDGTFEEGRKPTLYLMDKEMEACNSDSEIPKLSLPSCPEGNENVCMYKWRNTPQNHNEEVFASCIVGPQYWWCQYANTEDLNIVSRLAQEAGQTQEDVMFPETLGPGSPCLAQFSSDNRWYRAQVIRRVEDAFHVLFIDYGNESDVTLKNVRALPHTLVDKAPQAFLCSLQGFDESKGSWNDDVYDDFYNLLIDKPLKLTLFNMEEHSEAAVPQYVVEIECEGAIVNAAMKKYWKPVAKGRLSMERSEGKTFVQHTQTESNSPITHPNVCKETVKAYRFKKPNLSYNTEEEVYASCIVQPHYFWCQYTNTEELNEVSRLAQEAGQTQEDVMFPESLCPGSPCLAQFSSDKQWYRAQVIRRVDDSFTVLFIDYGNESDVDMKNVRSLPQGLLEKAPQAFLCSLKGFDESKGSWNDDVYDDFYNLLIDKHLNLTVFNMEEHSEAAVPQYVVEIECEGAIINAAMKKYWKPVAKGRLSMERSEGKTFVQHTHTESNSPITHPNVCKETVNKNRFKKPNLSYNTEEKVYASCIVQPHYFWCQYTNTEELNEVSRLAQEAGQTQEDVMFPETLCPSSPCLAQFSSDKQWYRAQVIRRVDDSFTVLFIDFGNESDVDMKNVRSLPQGLLEKAPQAFLCSLKGFDESKGSWNDDVYDDFYNLLIDKHLNLTVFNMEEHSEAAVPQYVVELECEGSVVNKLMEKHWKGLITDHTSE